MKRRDLCKLNISEAMQQEAASRYYKEAVAFQHAYNASNPERRIWRHMLYRRVFYFLRQGVRISVKIEIVRFIYAGTNSTFTFYGTLFFPRTPYSREFVCSALSDSGTEASFYVSLDTVRRWRKNFFASAGAQDHNWAPPAPVSGMV